MFLANKLNKGSAPPAAKDPQFNYVTMLLHGDGTNGGWNNTFLESSTNTFTITRNGNTTQGSFSPYGSNWSNYFDGSGNSSYLSLASGTALGTGNVTIEFWFNPSDTSVAYRALYDGRSTVSTNTGFGIFQYGQTIEIYGAGLKVSSAASAFTANTWTHFAVVRTSGTCQIYINGVASGSSASYSNDLTSTIRTIGSGAAGGNYFQGYISNLREVTSALYSGTFTPSTTPLTAVSSTTLLTCQSNRFSDNSTNNYAITPNGTPSVQRFNPFGASTAYSTSVIGGSGYFDGTGDYLTIADNAAFTLPADFTIECWFFQTGAFKDTLMIDKWTEYYLYTRANGVIGLAWGPYNASGMFGVGGIVQSGSNGFVLNAWTHVAAVRNSNTFTLYINGVSVSTATNSATVTAGGAGITIGNYSGGGYAFQGYMSNARIVKGTAVYTAAFTPPTAPVTAISGTSLLTNFTNGAIFDNAMMNDLETVGNAQISTSVVKYGTGSLAFDGTGDYLSTRSTPNLSFGSGDFTIEAWVYANSLGSYNAVFAQWPDNGGTANNSYTLETVGSNMEFYWASSAGLHGPATLGTITTGVWIHYAICRSGNTLYPFKNGVLGTTTSITQTLNSPTSAVTVGGEVASAGYWNGYIDDLRITKGYARYTATFTPPTAAFLDIGPN